MMGGDNIYQLSQAGYLYPVRMTQHGDEHAAHQQCIFKVIYILQLMRSLYPFFQLSVRIIAVIPHVPFIKGQVDLFLASLLRLYTVTDGKDGADKFIHALGICQKFRCIIVPVSIILMQGKIIHLVIALAKHFLFPITEGIHGQG